MWQDRQINFLALKKALQLQIFLATFAIFWESVVTIILSIIFEFFAYKIVLAIKGILSILRIFLFLRPFDPPLAGMMQIEFSFFSFNETS